MMGRDSTISLMTTCLGLFLFCNFTEPGRVKKLLLRLLSLLSRVEVRWRGLEADVEAGCVVASSCCFRLLRWSGVVNAASSVSLLLPSSGFSDDNNGESSTGSFRGTGLRAAGDPRGTTLVCCCCCCCCWDNDGKGMDKASWDKQGERGGTYGRLS